MWGPASRTGEHGEHVLADCAVKSGKLRICPSDTSTSLARPRIQSYVELFTEIRAYRDRRQSPLLPLEGVHVSWRRRAMRTRAAIHVGHGAPQVVDEVALPEPGPSQITVRLFASGICHSQLHRIHDPNVPTPSILGH
jgi:hypothetical protein